MIHQWDDLKRRWKSVPGTRDNSVCSEAKWTIWEIKDISEAREDMFIQTGLEIE